MKTIRLGTIPLVMIVLFAPMLYGQDLSKYRNFSFGMSPDSICKLVQEDLSEVMVVYSKPALIQELTWYPSQPFESARPAEPVEKIIFSFYNGALYRMLVTYDGHAIKGLTDEDMIRAISAKYGTAARPAANASPSAIDAMDASEKVIAKWENIQYSIELIQSSWESTYSILLLEKKTNAQAVSSIAESVKLDREDAPEKEAARAKQVAADLEAERERNIKALRP